MVTEPWWYVVVFFAVLAIWLFAVASWLLEARQERRDRATWERVRRGAR